MYTKERVSRNCKTCGKEVIILLSKVKNNKDTYCSRPCSWASKKKEKIRAECPVCNTKFEIFPSRDSRTQNNYCSPKCSQLGAHLRVHNYDSEGNLLEKWCPGCLEWLSSNKFGKFKKNKSGLRTRCKGCRFIEKYGNENSKEDILNLLESDSCQICGSTYRLTIDHNHFTGKIRDRLCSKCNVIVGFSEENSDLLRKIANYIDDHKTKG